MTRIITALLLMTPLQAQQPTLLRLPKPPYSYLLTNLFFGDFATMHVIRGGNLALVEVNIPPHGLDQKPSQKRILFDFASHLVYVQDEAGCRTFQNELDGMPQQMDALASNEWVQYREDQKLIGREVVNGLPTRKIKSGTNIIWFARDYDFPVRVVWGYEGVVYESSHDLKQLSFAAPPGTRFEIPTSCAAPDPAVKPLGNDYDATWEAALLRQAGPLNLPPPVYSMRIRYGIEDSKTEVAEVDRDHNQWVLREPKQTTFFDLAQHRVTIRDSSGCRTTGYLPSEPAVKYFMDPAAANSSLSFLRQRAVKTQRWEVWHGMRTRVVDNRFNAGPFTEWFRLHEKYDFALSYATKEWGSRRPATVAWEVERVTFTAPAASVFEEPKDCTVVPGAIDAEATNWDAFKKAGR